MAEKSTKQIGRYHTVFPTNYKVDSKNKHYALQVLDLKCQKNGLKVKNKVGNTDNTKYREKYMSQ